MSAPAANLAEIAAGSLRRLAAETRATVDEHARVSTGVPGHLDRLMVAGVAETRREALAALLALWDALPAGSEHEAEATDQMRLLGMPTGATADDCDRWAREWDAWALAADPVAGGAS